MNWEEFVKDFVSEVDYDRAKNLDAATAEIPEEAEGDFAKLVAKAKEIYEKHK